MEAEHSLLGSRVSKTALKTSLSQTSLCLEVGFRWESTKGDTNRP